MTIHRLSRENKLPWVVFGVSVTFLVTLFIFGVYLGVYWRDRHLLMEEVAHRARAHFANILLTRRWNARHGGVYVVKTPGMRSNPYLEHPDLVAADGTVYTKKNPALMTREISDLAAADGMFTYHITSLKPLNPGNAPDGFEAEALRSFRQGVKEAFRTFTARDGEATFRYMAPLLVEQSCMPCHAKQGYHLGEVRGGISVSFPVTGLQNAIRTSQRLMIALIIFSGGGLLAILYLAMHRLMKKLAVAQALIQEMAVTDELTGIANRRAILDKLQAEALRAQRYPEGCALIMIDLDHFKRINDDHGHATGDMVLRRVAGLLDGNIRQTDTVARYGGEEFVIMLPHTSPAGALRTADKLRETVAREEFVTSQGQRFRVTLSAGVAGLDGEDGQGRDVEAAIQRADAALYQAKKGGRNRVEVYAGATEA